MEFIEQKNLTDVISSTVPSEYAMFFFLTATYIIDSSGNSYIRTCHAIAGVCARLCVQNGARVCMATPYFRSVEMSNADDFGCYKFRFASHSKCNNNN